MLQIVILLILTIGAFWLTTNRPLMDNLLNRLSFGGNITPSQAFEATAVKINQTIINVEIANSNDEKAKGLSGRDSLDPSAGMLFIYDKKDRYSFWMKGMKIPIDFIWIEDKTVVDIFENASPPEPGQAEESFKIYQPSKPVDKILEVNTGFISQHGIKIGDSVEYLK